MTILSISQTNQTTNYYTHNEKYNTVSNAKKKKRKNEEEEEEKKKWNTSLTHNFRSTTQSTLLPLSPYTPCPGSEMPPQIG
jgi:hypothetical protein